MIDETTTTAADAAATGSTSNTNAEPAGFCQDCGRPLSTHTVRTVGTSVFCEPCLQVRLQGGTPGTAYGRTAAPPSGGPVGAMPPVPGEPSPTLAAFLGLIPGVGAMYNGQFAKGIAHIAIFAVLSFLSEHVNGVFGIMIFGWVVYQVFDAMHTAQARRDGLLLPDTFGLNDIGDRIGYGKSWSAGVHHYPRAAATAPADPVAPPAAAYTAAAAAEPAAAPASDWAHVPVQPVSPPVPNPADYANWAGYVPPGTFAQAPFVRPSAAGVAAAPLVPLQPPARRFPVAAVVLISLGFLFLLANVVPSFHISPRWAAPLVLGIFAVWSLYRRVHAMEQLRATAALTGRSWIASVIRLPLLFATVALIMTLYNLGIATVAQTWPLLLIILGGLALLDRTTPLPPVDANPYAAPAPNVSGAAASPSDVTATPEVRS